MCNRILCFLGVLLLIVSANGQELKRNVSQDLSTHYSSGQDINSNAQRVTVNCQADSMCVHLNKEWLQTIWGVIDVKNLKMKQSCNLSTEDTGSQFIVCTPKAKLTSCGSEIVQNDTHVTIKNIVRIFYPLAPHLSLSVLRAAYPWTCTYPLKLLVETHYLPQISPVTIIRANTTSTGEFEAAMFLYKDDNFQHVFESVPHLNMNDRLRIKAQLLHGPKDSTLQIVKCWATSAAFPAQRDESYTLIDNFCPADRAARVKVSLRNNGDRHHALWESNVFRFVSNPNVFIHCHVRVCFDGAKCKKECPRSGVSRSRKRREIPDQENGVLTLGPLEMDTDVSEWISDSKPSREFDAKRDLITVKPKTVDTYLLGMPRIVAFIVIAGLGLVCVLFIVGVSVAIFRKSQNEKRKTQQIWEEQLATRHRISKTFTLSNGPPFEIPLSVPNTLMYSDRRASERVK